MQLLSQEKAPAITRGLKGDVVCIGLCEILRDGLWAYASKQCASDCKLARRWAGRACTLRDDNVDHVSGSFNVRPKPAGRTKLLTICASSISQKCAGSYVCRPWFRPHLHIFRPHGVAYSCYCTDCSREFEHPMHTSHAVSMDSWCCSL